MEIRRIYFLDTIKTVIIAVVVMFHGAMSYMMYGPEWWYVVDEQKSIVMTAFVVWADVFIMPVMFFISGYVGALSLHRKAAVFWKLKWKRIGLPWIVGSIGIAPYIAYLYAASRQLPMTFCDFYTQLFWGVFYQQAQYWYLGVLMALYGLLYVYHIVNPQGLKPERKAFTMRYFIVPVFLCMLGMAAALCAYNDSEWIHPLYILCFQPTRMPIYAVVFFLGVCAWRCQWFSGRPFLNPLAWGLSFIILSAVYLSFRLAIPCSWNTMPGHTAVFSIFHSVFCLVALYAVLAFFWHAGNVSSSISRILASSSYGVYYVHQLVVLHVVWMLRPWNVPVFGKYIVMSIISLVLCFLISRYVLTYIRAF